MQLALTQINKIGGCLHEELSMVPHKHILKINFRFMVLAVCLCALNAESVCCVEQGGIC